MVVKRVIIIKIIIVVITIIIVFVVIVAVAVSALVSLKDSSTIMDKLEKAGATDILLFAISNSRM